MPFAGSGMVPIPGGMVAGDAIEIWMPITYNTASTANIRVYQDNLNIAVAYGAGGGGGGGGKILTPSWPLTPEI